uniref:Uncharacterized protein n=1 Tax=Romanomermis culicivorax TaxID=13658 RepID=A0A915HVP6_ROMCU
MIGFGKEFDAIGVEGLMPKKANHISVYLRDLRCIDLASRLNWTMKSIDPSISLVFAASHGSPSDACFQISTQKKFSNKLDENEMNIIFVPSALRNTKYLKFYLSQLS